MKKKKARKKKAVKSTKESKAIEPMEDIMPTEKPVTIADSREYTEEQIAAFREECGKKPIFTIAQFKEAILKPCEELTYKDVRIIVSKVGWLSDDEKKKFRPILYVENLTEDELAKYTSLYGNGHQFQKYFYKKESR